MRGIDRGGSAELGATVRGAKWIPSGRQVVSGLVFGSAVEAICTDGRAAKTRAKLNQTVQPRMLKVGRKWARIQLVGDGDGDGGEEKEEECLTWWTPDGDD